MGLPAGQRPSASRGLPVVVLLSAAWRHRRVCERAGRPPGLERGYLATQFREAVCQPALFGFPPYFLPLATGLLGEPGSHTCQPRTNKYFGGWEAAHELSALLGTGTNRACTTACSSLPVRRRCRRRSSLKPISCRGRLWGSKDLSPGFGEGCGRRAKLTMCTGGHRVEPAARCGTDSEHNASARCHNYALVCPSRSRF